MPIPIPPPLAPYDLVDDVLNLARTRVNDAIVSIGGEILADNQPFTQVMTNGAWLKLQQFLAGLGYSRFRKRTVLTGLPVVASQDPASETILTWQWFFDGVSYWYPPNTPVLPQDMISPLRIGERQSVGFQPTLTAGSSAFSPVKLSADGNPCWRKRPWNGWFDWRAVSGAVGAGSGTDGIVMPGSLVSMDLEIYYSAYLPDFETVGEVQWNQQQVPIMRARSALANYVAAEFAAPRGDLDAASFVTAAEQDARLIFNASDVPLKQRNNVSRRSFAGNRAGMGSGGYGYGGL